ncbi:MAG TPA: hypothetical protein VN649_20450 [Ramlibacter sp.]|nr:hypothetical protein [Ramlibacter sp.]
MKHSDFATSRRWTVSADRRIRLPVLGTLLVAALTAPVCAFASEGKYHWRQGWREATVDKIEDAAPRGRYFFDCRRRAETGKLASGPFVVLTYEHMGRTHHRVVPLRKGETYRLGDLVYVNVRSCDTPLVLRTHTVEK